MMYMDLSNSKMVQLLRERGLRPTIARRQILTLLIKHDTHLSTDEILRALRKKGSHVGTATIYQNLVKLVDAGLISRFTGAEGIIRYDSNLVPHHHLICIRCGKVVDVAVDESRRPGLRPRVLRTGKSPGGWKLKGVQLEFKGVCPKCLRDK